MEGGSASLLGWVLGLQTVAQILLLPFGGVIADIVCNEVPGLFRPDTPLYATCAFAGGWGLIGLQQLSVSESVAFPAATFVVVAMRLAALKFRIVLRSTDNPHGQTQNP